MPRVVPQVMEWARETAGLSTEDAARKLGFRDTKGRGAADRLSALERGIDQPSRSVLLRMAKHYRRPLITFYLPSPPKTGARGEDFRTLPHAPAPSESAVIDALVRSIRSRQQMVRTALEDEEFAGVGFVGAASLDEGVRPLVERIRTQLNYTPGQHYRARTPEEAFRELRSRVEAAGVYVLLMGNLGSHHTTIDVDLFRGFALADSIAPFIVINDQDAKAAWSFTLLHELAHLWLGQTGISAGRPELQIERFCNEVASQFLLPTEELQLFPERLEPDFNVLVSAIEAFARPRKLSYSLVAYRLHLIGRVTREDWARLSDHFREMWRRQRVTARNIARENDAGGPNYYVIRRQKIGAGLLAFVRRRLESGDLVATQAAKILGVKARSVFPLLGGTSAAESRIGS